MNINICLIRELWLDDGVHVCDPTNSFFRMVECAPEQQGFEGSLYGGIEIFELSHP